MVSGGGAGRYCNLDAWPRTELVGVDPGLEAAAGAGPQHFGGLVSVKSPSITKNVHPLGKGGAAVKHLRAHEAYVGVSIAGILGRHHVGPEEGDLGSTFAGHS